MKNIEEIEYAFLSQNTLGVKVRIDGVTVEFEKDRELERIDHSTTYEMNGYLKGEITYSAIGEYLLGSDDFVGLTEIEKG